MVNDPALVYLGGMAIYGVIWAYVGLRHFNAPKQGLGLIGYGSVAASAVMCAVILGWGIFGS